MDELLVATVATVVETPDFVAETEIVVDPIDDADVVPVAWEAIVDAAAVGTSAAGEVALYEDEAMIAGRALRPDISVVKAMAPQVSTRAAAQAAMMTPLLLNGCVLPDELFSSTAFIRSFCSASGVS